MAANQKSGLVKWLLILLFLGGAVAAAVFYYKRPRETAIDYRTAAASRGEITQSVTANGQITPVKNVQVGSEVSGKILKINVDFNSMVKEGDVIAEIDPSAFEQNVMQTDADLANAQASLELAELNWRRAADLRKVDLIPQADADTALASLHQAEAVVKMRKAALQKTKVDMSKTTIYAPISGIVISRNVDVGQTVAASFNTPTLFLIANDLSKMEIDAMVSEADVGGVEEGQKVTFTVDAFPARQFSGSVRQVRYAPTTNQNVVTYTCVVEVHNDDLKLRPGMTANASIITASRSNVLRIPNAALRFRPPEGALVIAATNAPGGSNSTRVASSGGLARTGRDGMPVPPWVAEGRRPTPEERQKWMDSLTPEQREQVQQMRARMQAQFGSGGSGFGSASRSSPVFDGPATRTAYILAKTNSPAGREIQMARAVTVKTGITDGNYTEVLDGLAEGDVIIAGLNQTASATGNSARPPGSGNPFGGGGGPPRR